MQQSAWWKAFFIVLVSLLAIAPTSFKAIVLGRAAPQSSQPSSQQPGLAPNGPQVSRSTRNDRSKPLRETAADFMPPPRRAEPPVVAIPEVVFEQPGANAIPNKPDHVVQTQQGNGHIPLPELTFEGLSSDDNAAIVGVRPLPPDPNGDVGPDHYMQVVNLVFAVPDDSQPIPWAS